MSIRRLFLLLLVCQSFFCREIHCFQSQPPHHTATRCRSKTRLASSSKNNNNNDDEKPKGVYVRPSAVIEKGSGFFFPGLEGPRVRLFVGSGLLLATAVNHFASDSTSGFSEAIGVAYSLLVLLQGAIETSKEGRIESIAARENEPTTTTSSSSSSSSKADLVQQWSANASVSSRKNRVEWAAASYLSLTPATHVILLHEQDAIRYWLGPNKPDNDGAAAATAAALKTIRQSKGGRVALPSDHPAATGILADETFRKCVVLQRINNDQCWMVASNDLLASFTRQDLQWLGLLARYVDNKE